MSTPGHASRASSDAHPALRAELLLFGEKVIGALSLVDGVVVPDSSIANLLAHLPVSGPDGKGSWLELTPADGINYIRALHGQLAGYLTIRLLDQPQAQAPKSSDACTCADRPSGSPDPHRPCAHRRREEGRVRVR